MRWIAMLAAAVVAAAVPASVAAEPPQDFVTGAGWVAFTDFPSPGVTTTEHFVVSAHAGALGEDPQGTMILLSPFGDQRVEVTCLHVTGSRAVVGGRITSGGTYLGLDVTHLVYVLEDNGQGEGAPDTATGFIFINRPPEFDPCTPALEDPAAYIVRGNFVVNDA